MATIRSVTNVLGEFYSLEYDNPELSDFFSTYSIGFPLSYHIWSGLAEPTDKSAHFLNQSWIAFCDIYGIDPHNDFDSLKSFLDFNESVS